MKSRKSVRKSRAKSNQDAQKQMHDFLDPAADQHLEMDLARTEQEKDPGHDVDAAARGVMNILDAHYDGSAAANLQDIDLGHRDIANLATNRIVSYPGTQEFTEPEREIETLLKGDGTVHKVLEFGCVPPQFVLDLEAAIDAADLAEHDTGRTVSDIAAELLKHPALHGYLDQGVAEIAHADFPDCEYPNAVLPHFGDYGQLGSTPTEQDFLGNVVPEPDPLMDVGMDRWERRRPQLIAQARNGMAALQELAGMAAEHKGFHEDRPVQGAELQNWQGNKLMLIVSEVVEAHDEIRTGHSAYETYYPDFKEVRDKLQKPEGVPSEIADVVIRSADFAWTEGFDLADIIIEKLEYNATRGHKHGKAF